MQNDKKEELFFSRLDSLIEKEELLSNAVSDLIEKLEKYEKSKKHAKKSSNRDKTVDASTLARIMNLLNTPKKVHKEIKTQKISTTPTPAPIQQPISEDFILLQKQLQKSDSRLKNLENDLKNMKIDRQNLQTYNKDLIERSQRLKLEKETLYNDLLKERNKPKIVQTEIKYVEKPAQKISEPKICPEILSYFPIISKNVLKKAKITDFDEMVDFYDFLAPRINDDFSTKICKIPPIPPSIEIYCNDADSAPSILLDSLFSIVILSIISMKNLTRIVDFNLSLYSSQFSFPFSEGSHGAVLLKSLQSLSQTTEPAFHDKSEVCSGLFDMIQFLTAQKLHQKNVRNELSEHLGSWIKRTVQTLRDLPIKSEKMPLYLIYSVLISSLKNCEIRNHFDEEIFSGIFGAISSKILEISREFEFFSEKEQKIFCEISMNFLEKKSKSSENIIFLAIRKMSENQKLTNDSKLKEKARNLYEKSGKSDVFRESLINFL